MHRFYISPEQIAGEEIAVTGDDVNHMKNVLRLTPGEEVALCDGCGTDYVCEILQISPGEVRTKIRWTQATETELPVKLVLFQGIPKKDKMEWIIQKAVELGASEIVPVKTKRTIVKIEDRKKEQKKLERWNAIAQGAAKQSQRGIVPKVREIMDLKEALAYGSALDCMLIPYELEKGMEGTAKAVRTAAEGGSAGIFIGPEGGFEPEEVILAREAGAVPVSLGRRILRTETAGMTALSILMYQIETAQRKSEAE